MREIKFRAWIESVAKGETGLYYPTVFELIHDGSVDRFFTNEYRFKSDTCKFTLMQYTGLKDKNGVEIYEGDIISWSILPLNENVKKVRDVVIYRNGAFSTKERIALLGTLEPHREPEVIGNIYENPELVK